MEEIITEKSEKDAQLEKFSLNNIKTRNCCRALQVIVLKHAIEESLIPRVLLKED